MHQNFLQPSQFFLARELTPLVFWPNLSKHCHTNIFTSQVILTKLKGLGIVLSNGFKDHQTLKLSTKFTALIKVITLSRSLLFVPKVVPLVIISDAYVVSATGRFITADTNIAAQFTPGYSVLFDKGFNVQDLFLQYKVTAGISFFVRSK